jgi:hypothetical protein
MIQVMQRLKCGVLSLLFIDQVEDIAHEVQLIMQ